LLGNPAKIFMSTKWFYYRFPAKGENADLTIEYIKMAILAGGLRVVEYIARVLYL